MSIEVTLITSLLASALGSGAVAETLVRIFKQKYRAKTEEEPDGFGNGVFEPRKKYLTSEQEASIATEAAIEALDETYQSTSGVLSERMRQANLAFNAAL